MKAVLYTHDMEPITILTLNKFALECLQRYRRFIMRVYEPFDYLIPPEHPPTTCEIWSVAITCEILMRRRKEHMILFTEQEEHALLLRASFLPGQTHALNERYHTAFARGFLTALNKFGE
jgi:hypothetical protein